VLAFFLKLVPKVGPFRALDFKIPTQQTEDLYIGSVDRTLDNYRVLLMAQGEGERLQLVNMDFDTGRVTHAGEYVLTDNAYAHLLDQLAEHRFASVTPELREDLLAFYSDPNAPIATKRDAAAWQKTQDEVRQLKNFAVPPKPENVVSRLR